jgi:hypothetical protein
LQTKNLEGSWEASLLAPSEKGEAMAAVWERM